MSPPKQPPPPGFAAFLVAIPALTAVAGDWTHDGGIKEQRAERDDAR